ncbi:Alpha-galactosidase [Actinacidiphila bryophytorum]|uniref:Alpha-galactosidase n=2 Tax=Actinacidiphila bryophytorum TaxID=1436133 RepID=A0A9W4MFQ3_9ACTN|nr:Alpha-galactosidase [Actinacidiphila bryophytorum]
MMIETGGSGRLWLLSGPHSSYALHVTERDELLHLHWGRRIALADAEALAADPLPAERPFESALDGHEEYPVEGGPRFVRPALSVRSREVRGTEWCFEEYETAADPATGHELRLHFHDSLHHLDLTLHYRMRPGCDVVERWTTATHVPNGHRAPLELLRADAATWTLPHRDGWRMSQLHGRWGAESRLLRGPLTPGERVIGSRRGHTGHQHLPWFALDAGDAGEEHGEVWTGALAWSGSWRIAVAALPDGRVQATGGAGHDDAGLVRLDPGASYTSPVFAALWSGGGFGAASRAWHAYQRDHVVPGGRQPRPVLYNSWEATGFDVGEAQQRELARRAAAMGVELFVVDDGWFGDRVSDRAGLGDWTPNPDRFPNGLKPLSDEVHALGMQFGLWVEPEMVNPDSDLYRAHPDWVQHHPGRRSTEYRHQLVLNLARTDVREHLAERLDALLHSAPVDYLKWDFNRCFTDPGWPGERYPERLWTAHVEGLYELVDRLRAAHPGLAVESCSGGGGRVDLGILARTDQVWTSDNTDPLDRLHIQHGFSQLHPARVMAAWVTDSPSPMLNHRRSSLRFRFVSAMAGVLGVGGDLLDWSAEERAEAASWVALYKTIRPVVQQGDLYRLRPPDGGGLSAVQYVHGADTVVLAWLPAQAFGAPVPPLRLRGLDRDAAYRDVTTGVVQRGAVLAERGLRTTLAGDLDAAVFHLRRL